MWPTPRNSWVVVLILSQSQDYCVAMDLKKIKFKKIKKLKKKQSISCR